MQPTNNNLLFVKQFTPSDSEILNPGNNQLIVETTPTSWFQKRYEDSLLQGFGGYLPSS